MKVLYLDCSMGIAGDMLMGALLELFPDKQKMIDEINGFGIPGVIVSAEENIKCGIKGTHVNVRIHGEEEHSQDVKMEHTHEMDIAHHEAMECHGGEVTHHAHVQGHAHVPKSIDAREHSHPRHHHHASLEHILHQIHELSLPDEVKEDVCSIYQLIAAAESEVHAKTVTEIHFHEVGMMDAVADIAGCAYLLYKLGVEKIMVSPVNVGFGQVKCAHGILPVPAPATANLLTGIPCYAGRIEGELCTPTGAALMKHFASQFGTMPVMTIMKTGYGMGTKEFETANCVRAMLGEEAEESDEILELNCNIDDMTPEELGYAMELLFKNGALDVYTTAVGMKKCRPGILLAVICKEKDRKRMGELIFQHTSTIGIREKRCSRMVLRREEKVLKTSLGTVRVKESSGFGIKKEKMEFEDLKRIADRENLSIYEVKDRIKKENGDD